MSSPLAGALMTTFFAPASMCAFALSASVKIPVDSRTMSTPIAPHGRAAGGPLVCGHWRRARAPPWRAPTPRCDALIVRCRESERPPPSGGGRTLDEFGSASAADLEDLVAALRAGALQRRLAVLHRDPLRVLDFDLHLVLDAVGFGHGAGSSSV